jgi:hypothetical protein
MNRSDRRTFSSISINNRKKTKGRMIFRSHIAQINGLNIVPGFSVVGKSKGEKKKLGDEEAPDENRNII